MKTESVSPHRIQKQLSSAQFYLKPAEIAGLRATGRDIPSVDIRLVHRLGTTNVVFSAINRRNGKAETNEVKWRVVDSMTVDITIFAPLYDEYDVTVVG